MILIISQETDGSTIQVQKWLEYYKAKYYVLNVEDKVELEHIEIEKSGNISIIIKVVKDNFIINFDNIKYVWYRRGEVNFNFSYINYENKIIESQINKFILSEYKYLTDIIYYKLGQIKHLSDFRNTDLNKIIVLSKAVECGLEIPRTLITTNKNNPMFDQINEYTMINKAIFNGLRLKLNDILFLMYTEKTDLKLFPNSFFPTLFQENIQKWVDLRIFYILGNFYSVIYFSQKNEQTSTDFRKYNFSNPGRTFPFSICEEIQKKLTNLMTLLDLETGSIDMIIDKKGSYFFLEINPIGQYSMVSEPCNFLLDKIIAKTLIE